jgi:hypothetical protein
LFGEYAATRHPRAAKPAKTAPGASAVSSFLKKVETTRPRTAMALVAGVLSRFEIR